MCRTQLDSYYPDYTDSRLVSATMQLPTVNPGEELQLRFQHWFAYYGGSHGEVQISVSNADGSWSEWTTISGDYGNVNSMVWTRAMAELTAYAGETVRLGFFHIADTLQ